MYTLAQLMSAFNAGIDFVQNTPLLKPEVAFASFLESQKPVTAEKLEVPA
jgi:hypothetical protein